MVSCEEFLEHFTFFFRPNLFVPIVCGGVFQALIVYFEQEWLNLYQKVNPAVGVTFTVSSDSEQSFRFKSGAARLTRRLSEDSAHCAPAIPPHLCIESTDLRGPRAPDPTRIRMVAVHLRAAAGHELRGKLAARDVRVQEREAGTECTLCRSQASLVRS